MARKSAATLDREASENARIRAEHAQLLTLNAQLREKIKADAAEILRVQALLRITQVKLKNAAKAQAAKPVGASFKERCQAFFAATGARSVTPTELREWEVSNAQ